MTKSPVPFHRECLLLPLVAAAGMEKSQVSISAQSLSLCIFLLCESLSFSPHFLFPDAPAPSPSTLLPWPLTYTLGPSTWAGSGLVCRELTAHLGTWHSPQQMSGHPISNVKAAGLWGISSAASHTQHAKLTPLSSSTEFSQSSADVQTFDLTRLSYNPFNFRQNRCSPCENLSLASHLWKEIQIMSWSSFPSMYNAPTSSSPQK